MKNLRVKIYSDGADVDTICRMDAEDLVDGFTTNPTLMANAGVKDYLAFAKDVLNTVTKKSISFEDFSDEISDMRRQAMILRDLADNVWVKIPVSNTKREYTYDLINELSHEGVKLNITALFTRDHVEKVFQALDKDTPSIISVFAGRIANAGIDPEVLMRFASRITKDDPLVETLWASSREVFNIIQAERCGTDIITLTPALIRAAEDIGRDLDEFSLDTVKMFYNDSVKSGFKI